MRGTKTCLAAVVWCAALAASAPSAAADAPGTFALRSLTPEAALKAARAALESCRKRGFQVAVAVTDRSGVTLVLLRDRFGGPHTPATATGKAWTAISFKMDTLAMERVTRAGEPSSGIRHLPGVVAVGGGRAIEAGGSTVGGIGVSGAPGGDQDDLCARDGIAAIEDDLEL